MDNEASFPVRRIDKGSKTDISELVAEEVPVTIILNDRELVTVLCSPVNLKYLAVGLLFSEGLIADADEINRIAVDESRGMVRIRTKEEKDFARELSSTRVLTSGCGRGASFYRASDATIQKVESEAKVSASEVSSLVREFQGSSRTYKETHGVHSAALCDANSILVFSEDIGRHNAIDKVFGECIINGISTDDRMIVTSGRLSSEIVLKVSRRGIPVLISKSAPTSLGIRFASDLGVTLIGFVRGNRINVYANEWRVQ